MNDDYFRIIEKGLPGELAFLSGQEVLLHFKNHLANFLLDKAVAVCYLNRFAEEYAKVQQAEVRAAIEYLLGKCLQLSPFDIFFIHSDFLTNPVSSLKLEILKKTNFEPDTFALIYKLKLAQDSADIETFLHQLLEVYPNYALAAGRLLENDFVMGKNPTAWLHGFKCPKRLQDDFNLMLFNHYAAMGCLDEADALWPLLPPADIKEVHLNFAAENARLRGDIPAALALYQRSLALDQAQAPVRFRLAELQRPSTKRCELVGQKKVAIYLYSWNKAELLGATLRSLASSNIGPASITVLLNGCTDDSLAVVQAAEKLFPENTFTVIPLHVNIGAPAARNWLINLPSTWDCDYVAFLDDDVDVPVDWLEWYLTVAEADEKIAVVGCKIVFPGQPAKLQYLFRYVGIARDDLLRLSLDTPNHQFDNGGYDFIRETRSVMGCLHLLRTKALRQVPNFDIRFSPSQVDDIDHDVCLCLAGYKVMYCGLVTCVHHQSSGIGLRTTVVEHAKIGNCIGNDVKMFYKHFSRMHELRALDNLSLLPWGDA